MIDKQSKFASVKGGSVRYVMPDGQIVGELLVPPGLVAAAEYLDCAPDGAQVEVVGLNVLNPRVRVSQQDFGAAQFSSAANPDYEPSAASHFEREMRMIVGRLAADNARLDARLRNLPGVETIPVAPEVVEPTEDAPGGQ